MALQHVQLNRHQRRKAARHFLRIGDVAERTGLSKAQIYAMVAKGIFPRQAKLAARCSGWDSHEIEEWAEAKLAERDEAAA